MEESVGIGNSQRGSEWKLDKASIEIISERQDTCFDMSYV